MDFAPSPVPDFLFQKETVAIAQHMSGSIIKPKFTKLASISGGRKSPSMTNSMKSSSPSSSPPSLFDSSSPKTKSVVVSPDHLFKIEDNNGGMSEKVFKHSTTDLTNEDSIKQMAAINTMNSRRVRKRRQTVMEHLYKKVNNPSSGEKRVIDRVIDAEETLKENKIRIVSPENYGIENEEVIDLWKQANYEAIRRFSARICSVAEQFESGNKSEAHLSDSIYNQLRKNALEILESIASLAPQLVQQFPPVVPPSPASPPSSTPHSNSMEVTMRPNTIKLDEDDTDSQISSPTSSKALEKELPI